MRPHELVESWRKEAALLRRRHDERAALILEDVADELADALRITDTEIVTLEQASEIGGYSVDHLGRMIREGRLANAGRPGAPRLLRRDVPMKASRTANVASIRRLATSSSVGARQRRAARSLDRRIAANE